MSFLDNHSFEIKGFGIVGRYIYMSCVDLIQNGCLPIMDNDPVDLIGYFDPEGNPHIFYGKKTSTKIKKIKPEKIKQILSGG